MGQIIVTIKVKSNNWMVWTLKLDSVQMLGKYKNSTGRRKQTLISKEWRQQSCIPSARLKKMARPPFATYSFTNFEKLWPLNLLIHAFFYLILNMGVLLVCVKCVPTVIRGRGEIKLEIVLHCYHNNSIRR